MIDWHRVSELRDEIGIDDFSEIVEIFLDEVEEEIGALRADVPHALLEPKLHFLKGSALNLGFADLAIACSSGEAAAKAGAYDQIDLVRVLQIYAASKDEFLTNLGTRFAA